MVGATLFSAWGSYQQGQYQQELGDYESEMADVNAKMVIEQSEDEAQRILQQGAQEEAVLMKKYRQERGTNIKNLAMSGITLSGSPLLVMNEIAEETNLQALGIRDTARRSASDILYKGKLTAAGILQSGNESKISGKYAYGQGLLGAGATLMQGGSMAYSQYQKTKTPKISGYPTTTWMSGTG